VAASEIFVDGQFSAADATQHRPVIARVDFPLLRGMIFAFLVAGITRIVFATAFEFYGDDIKRGMVVNTTALLICDGAEHGHTSHPDTGFPLFLTT
jgi:hypothetical protein